MRPVLSRARSGAAGVVRSSRVAVATAIIACFLTPSCSRSVANAPALARAAEWAPSAESGPHTAMPRVAALVPAPPVELTAGDGTGLRLASLQARAVVQGPLAFTELRLAFENPLDRTLEGTFRIALPARASLSRFAMKIGESWQEGEVVEKQAARRAYEDFLHRKQDPALLETSAGNEFSARVFPIPARATKEIVVSYAQEIVGDAPYVLPLRGLPKVDAIDVAVSVPGAAAPIASRSEQSWTPSEDFVVPHTGARVRDGLRSGDLALVRVRPVVESHPDPIGSAVVLLDTSASRALGLEDEIAQLRSVAERLGEARLVVACFDQSVEEVHAGLARDFGDAAAQRIRSRGALGASDLSRALAWAGARAKSAGARRVIVVGDGVATLGETDRARIVSAAKALDESGVERLDAVAMGGIRDDATMRQMTTAGLRRDGVVADGSLDGEALARRLTQATRSHVAVVVEGATWQWPRAIDGAQAGDEYLVYAEVPPGAPARVSIDGSSRALDLAAADRPMLERAAAEAKVESLLDEEGRGGDPALVRRKVVELSTTQRVMSPYTAMLVLETESDYQRFRIDRRSLADILKVEGSRVVRTSRSAAAMIAQPRSVERPADDKDARDGLRGRQIGDAFGAGGLGLSGTGEGGGGQAVAANAAPAAAEAAPLPAPQPAASEAEQFGVVGLLGAGAGTAESTGAGAGVAVAHGRLGGGHAVSAPLIREGATSVSGRLPPEVIQRIVRQNFGRFRLCYENGLRARPDLRGRVSVRFVISATGNVASASDAGSDLPDPGVVSCVVSAFRNVGFPSPEGGVVTVVYPILFRPGAERQGQVSELHLNQGSTWRPSTPAPGEDDRTSAAPPYAGAFADVMSAVQAHAVKTALAQATAWHAEHPGDVLALVALGEALEASGDAAQASRAYGSLIDLFPSRADMRRFAGERLERIRDEASLDVAIDTYEKAEEERPDHPSSHRLLAFALLKRGRFAQAFDAAVAGLAHPYPPGRFPGVDRILREDVSLIGAAWARSEPSQREAIAARVRAAGATWDDSPSLRFVLSWETDANDVDFHIHDAAGNHAFYGARQLASGGDLYADVTTGYGPECFAIHDAREHRAGPYRLQAHYYSRGPMGYGMGKVEIIEHDGRGDLTFDERPFVVMNDRAFVELGSAGKAR